MRIKIKGHLIKGTVLDKETRCAHYHSEIDRIAIKFFCCNTYFPCYECHEGGRQNIPEVSHKKNSLKKRYSAAPVGMNYL